MTERADDFSGPGSVDDDPGVTLLVVDEHLRTVGLDVSFPVAVEAPPFVTLTFALSSLDLVT